MYSKQRNACDDLWWHSGAEYESYFTLWWPAESNVKNEMGVPWTLENVRSWKRVLAEAMLETAVAAVRNRGLPCKRNLGALVPNWAGGPEGGGRPLQQ